ncbi:MAG TPA: hypothetical protein VG944_19420 [Fimbriimonas sp.]|nr:hypothetical protein [Fimbriimonas sp.]
MREARWERLFAAVFAVIGTSFLLWLNYLFKTFTFVYSIGMGVVVVVWMKALRHRPHPRVLHLLDVPRSEHQFPVRILLTAHRQRLGSDEGVISFIGGWLHFEGLRTAFSFKPDAVELKSSPKQIYSPIDTLMWKSQSQNLETHSLHYRINNFDRTVEIEPYNRIQGVPSPLREDFNALIRAWKKRDVPPEGESLAPPIAPLNQPFPLRNVVGTLVVVGTVGAVLGFAYLRPLASILRVRPGGLAFTLFTLSLCLIVSGIYWWVNQRAAKKLRTEIEQVLESVTASEG